MTSMILPQREVPVPSHLSPAAQAKLAMPPAPLSQFPAVEDRDGWRAYVAEADASMAAMLAAVDLSTFSSIEERQVEKTKLFILNPASVPADSRRVLLDIHGGALILGGGDLCCRMGAMMATLFEARTWTVDYRMAPDHPYPTALDDCMVAYRELLKEYEPHEIIVEGASAGGNLAAALVLRARDEGLPLPAGLVLLTPECDLTESGDSFHTNLGLDSALRPLMPVNLLYAAGHDLTHPYLSPLFGDFSKGFPPTMLTTGTRDLFLSNVVRMHRALRNADVEAELHVQEAGDHIGFPASPEEEAMAMEYRKFASKIWSRR